MKRVARYISTMAAETLAIVACMLVYPFKFKRIDLPKKGRNKPKILCVHGFLHNGTAWGYFRHHLKKAGIATVDTVNYHSVIHNIPKNALQLKKRIEKIKETTGEDVTVLIGHSLGGLVCLEYAVEHAPKDKTIHVITMASPLHGTSLARAGYGPSSSQMIINSPYLINLHERLRKTSHIHALTLASSADRIIMAPHAAFLKEMPFAEYEDIPALGHVSFLFSKRVIDRIIKYLQQHKII